MDYIIRRYTIEALRYAIVVEYTVRCRCLCSLDTGDMLTARITAPPCCVVCHVSYMPYFIYGPVSRLYSGNPTGDIFERGESSGVWQPPHIVTYTRSARVIQISDFPLPRPPSPPPSPGSKAQKPPDESHRLRSFADAPA